MSDQVDLDSMSMTADGNYLSPTAIAGLEHYLRIIQDMSGALLALCVVTAALRMFVRIKMLKHFGLDDGFMLLALTLFTALVALTYLGSSYEWDYFHGNQVAVSKLVMVQIKVAQWLNATYVATAVTIKISLAVFMLRIFGPHDKIQRFITIGVAAISALLGVVFFAMNFTCVISYESRDSEARCNLLDEFAIISLTWSVSNTVVDFTFSILCMNLIWAANLRKRAKAITSILLLFGSVGAVASVARIVAVRHTGQEDDNLQRMEVRFWSNMEAGICITAACLSSLRPLLKSCMERTKISGYYYRRYGRSTRMTGGNNAGTVTATIQGNADRIDNVVVPDETDPEKGGIMVTTVAGVDHPEKTH